MAANENNERYIAEAWINDGKEEEFKTSFLQNLLQQLQGHKDDSTGLNADRLDDKHYSDIHNEIIEKTVNLLSEIRIGNISFTKNQNESFLPFDVIHLNVSGHTYDIDNEEYQLPWAIESGQDETGVNLNMVFAKLYNMLQEEIDNSLSQEEMNQIKTDLLNPLADFKHTLDQAGALTSDGKLNAQSVNGLSFYVKTQEEYDELESEVKNHPRNVFIIRDSYQSDDEKDAFLLNQQPNTVVISKYYQFRVTEKEVEKIVENPGEDPVTLRVKEKWLQYRHQDQAVERRENETIEEWEARDNSTWSDMVKTADLVDNEAIVQLLMAAFENDTNFMINQQSFYNSLNEIPINDNSTLPLAKYIRWSGVRGLTSKYFNNPLPSEPSEDSEEIGDPRYINLDDFSDKIEEIIDEKITKNFENIYPVGSIYMSVKDVNPATLFGGTWEKLENRFLLGSGSLYPITYDSNGFSNKTGGAESVTLTSNQMPSHTHAQNSHSHTPTGGYYFLTAKNEDDTAPNFWCADHYYNLSPLRTQSSGGRQLIVAGNTNAFYIAELKNTQGTKATNTNTGGGQSHNNMPPYLVVNMWRRTAL